MHPQMRKVSVTHRTHVHNDWLLRLVRGGPIYVRDSKRNINYLANEYGEPLQEEISKHPTWKDVQ